MLSIPLQLSARAPLRGTSRHSVELFGLSYVTTCRARRQASAPESRRTTSVHLEWGSKRVALQPEPAGRRRFKSRIDVLKRTLVLNFRRAPMPRLEGREYSIPFGKLSETRVRPTCVRFSGYPDDVGSPPKEAAASRSGCEPGDRGGYIPPIRAPKEREHAYPNMNEFDPEVFPPSWTFFK